MTEKQIDRLKEIHAGLSGYLDEDDFPLVEGLSEFETLQRYMVAMSSLIHEIDTTDK